MKVYIRTLLCKATALVVVTYSIVVPPACRAQGEGDHNGALLSRASDSQPAVVAHDVGVPKPEASDGSECLSDSELPPSVAKELAAMKQRIEQLETELKV